MEKTLKYYLIYRLRGVVVIFALLVLALAFYMMDFEQKNKEARGENTENVSAPEIADSTEEKPMPEVVPERIDFQPAVDKWVRSVGGNKSVLVYDLERGENAGEYNTEEDYIMESLYKLFVVYEGYKRIENGNWNKNMVVNGYGQTLEYCLDSAIRNSDSSCAEPIWGMIGRAELNRAAHEEWGISEKTDISSLVSNVSDVATMMKRFYEHPDFLDEGLVLRMKDSFLNQPPSAGLCNGPCNWRQGLPSGFSDAVKVYNKVGWRWGTNTWSTYHDAAIIETSAGRHFIVVVMTNYISYTDIARLGTLLEEKI